MFETMTVEECECISCGQKFQGLVIYGVPDDVCSTGCMIDYAHFKASREAEAATIRESIVSEQQGKFCTVRNKPSNFPP